MHTLTTPSRPRRLSGTAVFHHHVIWKGCVGSHTHTHRGLINTCFTLNMNKNVNYLMLLLTEQLLSEWHTQYFVYTMYWFIFFLPQMENFITSVFSVFPLVTMITICPLYILHPVNSHFGVWNMQTSRKPTAPHTLTQWGWGLVDHHTYLEEKGQNRYKCVGAAGEQDEGSATVHPQRIISWCGNQPVQRNNSQCRHLLFKKGKAVMLLPTEN